MIRTRLASISLAASLLASFVAAPAVALAAGPSLTTSFPSVTVQPGSSVTFILSVSTPNPERVDLSVSGTPSDWTSTLRGSGTVINSVYTGGKIPEIDLEIKVPDSAKAGSQTITVTASGPGGTTKLPLDVVIQEAGAGGGADLTADFPTLKGTPTDTFTFNLTLANNGTQKTTYNLQGTGPDGWKVDVHPADNSQALTTAVDAGSTASITVTVTPPSNVQAGTFPVQVTAASGSSSAKSALQVEIAGAPGITLGTPNNVLNTSVTSGGSGTLQVTVTNSGTAPLTGVTLSASAPTGWKVSFDPTTLDTLQPNDAKTVTATITPANNALAGDYSLTITGTAGSTTDSVDIRTTVETSPLWGFIGIGIIVIVLIGLGWVFRRYGRR